MSEEPRSEANQNQSSGQNSSKILSGRSAGPSTATKASPPAGTTTADSLAKALKFAKSPPVKADTSVGKEKGSSSPVPEPIVKVLKLAKSPPFNTDPSREKEKASPSPLPAPISEREKSRPRPAEKSKSSTKSSDQSPAKKGNLAQNSLDSLYSNTIPPPRQESRARISEPMPSSRVSSSRNVPAQIQKSIISGHTGSVTLVASPSKSCKRESRKSKKDKKDKGQR